MACLALTKKAGTWLHEHISNAEVQESWRHKLLVYNTSSRRRHVCNPSSGLTLPSLSSTHLCLYLCASSSCDSWKSARTTLCSSASRGSLAAPKPLATPSCRIPWERIPTKSPSRICLMAQQARRSATRRSNSAQSKLAGMACTTFGSTPAASRKQTSSSFQSQLTPCSNGTPKR